MKNSSFALSAAFVCVLLVRSGVPAYAQPALIKAQIASSSPPVRSSSPVGIVWKISSSSTSLLEGHLEITLRDDNELLTKLVTDSIAISTGDSLHRTMLPPLGINSKFDAVEVEVRFLGQQKSFDLGKFPLRIPIMSQRSLVLAMVDARGTSPSPQEEQLLEALRLENSSSLTSDRTLTTYVSRVPPNQITAEPLNWCGFDMVVLLEDSFSELKDSQLQAIGRWAAAGGSVCVVPGRAVLENHHLRFLRDLAGAGETDELFLLDSRGRLLPTANRRETDDEAARRPAVLLARFGLGRSAIALDDLGDTLKDKAEMRRLTGFLWKLRRDRTDAFVDSGKWGLPAPNANPEGQPQLPANLQAQQYASMQQRQQMAQQLAGLRPQWMQLASTPIQTGDQLLEQLMPRDLKIVPLSLMGLILVVYVLAIGPVDYLLLGALKQRKWTWLLFPATTIGVALGTMWLSHWYMRVSDVPRRVTICDIGQGNEVARVNRFEALFRGTPSTVTTEVSRSLFSAMNLQRFSQGTWQNFARAQAGGFESQYHLVGPAQYAGRVPAQFAVAQFLPQWTPQLNRIFSLSAPDDMPAFDWQSLADLPMEQGRAAVLGAKQGEVISAIAKTFGPGADIYVATGDHLAKVSGGSSALMSTSNLPGTYGNPYVYMGQQNLATTFLQDICLYPGGGFFDVVSQLSPKGGDEFEDLALLDPSDPNQWLLVVTVPRGDDLMVYRKLYTRKP